MLFILVNTKHKHARIHMIYTYIRTHVCGACVPIGVCDTHTCMCAHVFNYIRKLAYLYNIIDHNQWK